MNNVELWQKAENGEIQPFSVFGDQNGNQIVFTGKSFQVYEGIYEDLYIGMCVGDTWTFIEIAE